MALPDIHFQVIAVEYHPADPGETTGKTHFSCKNIAGSPGNDGKIFLAADHPVHHFIDGSVPSGAYDHIVIGLAALTGQGFGVSGMLRQAEVELVPAFREETHYLAGFFEVISITGNWIHYHQKSHFALSLRENGLTIQTPPGDQSPPCHLRTKNQRVGRLDQAAWQASKG